MEHSELIDEMKRLDKRQFLFERVKYTVKDVNYYQSRYVVYTVEGRTFSKDISQFDRFLTQIKVLPLDGDPTGDTVSEIDEKTTFKPNATMDQQKHTGVATAVNNTETVNNELFKMFQTLSGEPKDEDYKKAEAMSKLANTMVSVSQTHINFLRLKKEV
jgi:hypothetical protein